MQAIYAISPDTTFEKKGKHSQYPYRLSYNFFLKVLATRDGTTNGKRLLRLFKDGAIPKATPKKEVESLSDRRMAKWMAQILQQEERTREAERSQKDGRARRTGHEELGGSSSDAGTRQTGPKAKSLPLDEADKDVNGLDGVEGADRLSDIGLPPGDGADHLRMDNDNRGSLQHKQSNTHGAIPTDLEDDDDDLYYQKPTQKPASKRRIDSPPPSRPRSPLPPPSKKARTSPDRPSTVALHQEPSPRGTRGVATPSSPKKASTRPRPRKVIAKSLTTMPGTPQKTRRTGLRSSGPAAPA